MSTTFIPPLATFLFPPFLKSTHHSHYSYIIPHNNNNNNHNNHITTYHLFTNNHCLPLRNSRFSCRPSDNSAPPLAATSSTICITTTFVPSGVFPGKTTVASVPNPANSLKIISMNTDTQAEEQLQSPPPPPPPPQQQQQQQAPDIVVTEEDDNIVNENPEEQQQDENEEDADDTETTTTPGTNTVPGPLTNKEITATNPKSTTNGHGILSSTLLRIQDIEKSKWFYETVLGMTLLKEIEEDVEQDCLVETNIKKGSSKMSEDEETVDKETQEGDSNENKRVKKITRLFYGYLKEKQGGMVELRYEGEKENGYCNGNTDDGRGYGHIGIIVGDLYEVVKKMENKGVKIRRKPGPFQDVGDIAFVEDPDGYWVELIQRSGGEKEGNIKGCMGEEPLMAQTMLRVKKPLESIRFWQKMGMRMLTRLDFKDLKFSLFFLAFADNEESMGRRTAYDAIQPKKAEWLWGFSRQTIELTHNWGTEYEQGPVYHSGNSEPVGFGYISVAVDNVKKTFELMKQEGYQIVKRPESGFVSNKTAIIKDPTGYWVKLVEHPTFHSSEETIKQSASVKAAA